MALDPEQLARRGRVVANVRVDAVASATEIESDGARLLNAATDDLLGLASDARVREAQQAAARKHGLGRLTRGKVVDDFEHRLARMLGAPAACVAADAASLLALLPTWRMVVEARSQHLAPGAAVVGSPEEAEDVLGGAVIGLITEALHPREGDLAQLPRFAEVCQRTGASLVVVDPAGLGVLGPGGAGTVEHLGLQDQVALQLVELGRAIPGAGAVLAGPKPLIDALRGACEPPPAALLAASQRALEIVTAEPNRRARLFEVAQRLLNGLRSRGFDTGPSVTPWVPVWLGDEALCEQWLRALADAGVACRALLAGQRSRLLLSVAATATDAQLVTLLDAFDRVVRKVRVPELAPSFREPLVVARPGSFAMATPCAAHWHALTPREREAEPEEPVANAATLSLRERLFDAVETLTWRATNIQSAQLRRTADAVRALMDRKKK